MSMIAKSYFPSAMEEYRRMNTPFDWNEVNALPEFMLPSGSSIPVMLIVNGSLHTVHARLVEKHSHPSRVRLVLEKNLALSDFAKAINDPFAPNAAPTKVDIHLNTEEYAIKWTNLKIAGLDNRPGAFLTFRFDAVD